MNDMIKPRLFPTSDEVPHDIGEHPLWQESVFLVWGQIKQGIVGFHRIGQECNDNEGHGHLLERYRHVRRKIVADDEQEAVLF